MEKDKMSPLDRFIGLLQLEKKDVTQVLFYAIFAGVVSLSLPLGVQAIINLLQTAQVTTSWVLLVVLVSLGVAFGGLLQLMQLRIIETIQQRIFTRSSFEFAFRFPKINADELRAYYPPELANRFFDTIVVQKGFSMILIDVPAAAIQIIFALILLSFYHPFFILFGLLLIILVYIVFKFTAEKGLKSSIEESKYKYKVAHWLQEIARMVTSFKVSGKTSLALQKNDELVVKYIEKREEHFKVLVIQFIQMISFKVIVTISLLILGGLLVLNQQMNIGQFVAAEIIILLVIASVEKLILSLEVFYDVLTSLEKLGEVVDKQLESQEGDTPLISEEFNLELKNVSYQVPNRDEPILKAIDLELHKQSKILIKGESGSGKSTLLRILAGIIKPTKGSLYVNDFSVDNLKLNHYRSHIGLVLLEETLFEGTLRENIIFNNDSVADNEFLEVLQYLGLKDFVKSLPNGLNTMIFPDDKQVSYTVSKRLLIARAILKQPKLLILEEPLEHLEEKETKDIIDYLTDPKHQWAIVVVSRNSYWESKCNQIILLNNGQLS